MFAVSRGIDDIADRPRLFTLTGKRVDYVDPSSSPPPINGSQCQHRKSTPVANGLEGLAIILFPLISPSSRRPPRLWTLAVAGSNASAATISNFRGDLFHIRDRWVDICRRYRNNAGSMTMTAATPHRKSPKGNIGSIRNAPKIAATVKHAVTNALRILPSCRTHPARQPFFVIPSALTVSRPSWGVWVWCGKRKLLK